MDNDFRLDLSEILAAVEKAEVLTIFLPLLGQVLLVDTRSDEVEGPLVQAVPMVASVEERVRSLERLRPRFGRPRGIVAIPWFRRVESLRELGVIASISRRLARNGRCGVDCETALQALLQTEQKQLHAAVKGTTYQTLWQRE